VGESLRFPHSLRLAHRGDWRVGPENTLAALAAAMRVPACDGVEFDVRLSADGVPVLLHDRTLARVQHRPERVDALSAAELATVGIPTLADALAMLPADAWLNIELKGADHGDATAAVLLAARGDAPTHAVISSFEVPTLAAMSGRLPGWTRWFATIDWTLATLPQARDLGCPGISVDYLKVTPARMAAARAAGIDVAVWTVRRRATFDRMARLGVVASCVEAAALDGDGHRA
jgi:glycerophosphoryl diester phosphodiesterase